MPVEFVKVVAVDTAQPPTHLPGTEVVVQIYDGGEALGPQVGQYLVHLIPDAPDGMQVGIGGQHPRKRLLGEQVYLGPQLLVQRTDDGRCEDQITNGRKPNEEDFWVSGGHLGCFCVG